MLELCKLMINNDKKRSRNIVYQFNSMQEVIEYLEEAFEDGSPQLISATLGEVAKSKGMTAVAAESGLGRESLYKALSHTGNPSFATILSVLRSLGLKLRPSESSSATSSTVDNIVSWEHDSPNSPSDIYLYVCSESSMSQTLIKSTDSKSV